MSKPRPLSRSPFFSLLPTALATHCRYTLPLMPDLTLALTPSSPNSEYTDKFPILVGEWCMSTGTYTQAGQSFVDAAVASFSSTSGWFIWNWKVEPGIPFKEWDVQYQMKLWGEGKGGLYPLNEVPPV